MIPYAGRRHLAPVAGAPALEVRRLTAAYSRNLALRDVSLVVPAGARIALVGANGAGKSTLLKAVSGLQPVPREQVRVYGNPVGACHHRVAYLAQRGEIDWRYPVTVESLVMTGRYVHVGWFRRPGRTDREAVRDALERTGISSLAKRQIGRLSGGQQQRALLARALAQEADLLLLDEPFNALDSVSRSVLDEVLTELQRLGKTLVIATHDLETTGRSFDDVVCLLNGRRVPFSGRPQAAPSRHGMGGATHP
ncbi:MAG: ABC transporter ATP-binding protein [Trueperaceae bacterium]